MELIILDNFKQLRHFEKLITNLKNYLIIATSGGIVEYLQEKKYKFEVFEIQKILKELNKKERETSNYFYEYL